MLCVVQSAFLNAVVDLRDVSNRHIILSLINRLIDCWKFKVLAMLAILNLALLGLQGARFLAALGPFLFWCSIHWLVDIVSDYPVSWRFRVVLGSFEQALVVKGRRGEPVADLGPVWISWIERPAGRWLWVRNQPGSYLSTTRLQFTVIQLDFPVLFERVYPRGLNAHIT